MTTITELKPEPQPARPNWNYHSYYAQQLMQSSIHPESHHRTDHRRTPVTNTCNAQQRSTDDLYQQQEATIKKIHALAETVGIQVKVFRD